MINKEAYEFGQTVAMLKEAAEPALGGRGYMSVSPHELQGPRLTGDPRWANKMLQPLNKTFAGFPGLRGHLLREQSKRWGAKNLAQAMDSEPWQRVLLSPNWSKRMSRFMDIAPPSPVNSARIDPILNGLLGRGFSLEDIAQAAQFMNQATAPPTPPAPPTRGPAGEPIR